MKFTGHRDIKCRENAILAIGNLQSPWETPFGRVTSGMENVKTFYKEYGDEPPWGKGPKQASIEERVA